MPEKAQAQHATIEEYAFTTGCLLIAQTTPGEKYQAPDGAWKTRTSAAAAARRALPLNRCRALRALASREFALQGTRG
jgi:hypothetical protein